LAESRRETLSIGVFLIIIVVAIMLYAAQVITDWTLIFPLILVLSGCWTLVLAGMRASNPQKYERGAFSTMGLGLLFIAVGGAWYLFTFNLLYSLALILLVLGVLAIAAALRRK
jgi:heme/copper-type cytochrome/quinol oxidase subunit 3